MQHKNKKPYFFMVDLPMSGSTLMAYVLDSHSKIHVEHEDSGKPYFLSPNFNLQWKIVRGFEEYIESFQIKKKFLVLSRYFNKKQIHMISSSLGNRAKYIILTRKYIWKIFFINFYLYSFTLSSSKGRNFIIPLKNIIKFLICINYIMNNFEYVKVSYNEMVSKPEETFSKICKFIGVDFEPEMLNYQNFEHKIRGNPKTRDFREIVDKSATERITLNLVLTTLKIRLIYFIKNTSSFYRRRKFKKTLIRIDRSQKRSKN